MTAGTSALMDVAALVPAAILVPAYAALALPLLMRAPNLREAVSLTAGVVLLAVVAVIATLYADGTRLRFETAPLFGTLRLAWHVEPLGLAFALLASFLWIITTVYAAGYMRGNAEKHQTRFFMCFAVAIASAMGIAFAGNLLTLFVFYEIMTLSTYPLVTHKGNAEARRAGRTYLGILMGTSIGLLLFAMLGIYHLTGTLDFTPGGLVGLDTAEPRTLAVLLVLAVYGVGKAALMPIHRWLPAAMVAPTPVSALLHAVAVVKAGVFTVVKLIVYIFGTERLAALASGPASVEGGATSGWLTAAWHWFAYGNWLAVMACVTILCASIVALRQDNLKRRLAYSTISQLSYVILGAAMFSGTGVLAAALHIVAHAFGKITLFFAAGAIYTAEHKTRISELDGIARRMPWTMTAFAIGALSMIGLPPMIGSVSKWYLVTASMQAESYWITFAIIASTVLNAAYFLPILHRAFFRGPLPGTDVSAVTVREAPWPMVVALLITAGLTIGLTAAGDTLLALFSPLVGLTPATLSLLVPGK